MTRNMESLYANFRYAACGYCCKLAMLCANREPNAARISGCRYHATSISWAFTLDVREEGRQRPSFNYGDFDYKDIYYEINSSNRRCFLSTNDQLVMGIGTNACKIAAHLLQA